MLYLKENYKKILPYAGIFFVLFMGSGLVKIPVGSVWFYVIKFGIIAAVLGIGVSAWWKAKKNNLPPNTYLKLALFVPFTIDFHLHYAFIFLTIVLFNKKLLLPWNSPLKPIYLLFIWGFISYVINQFVEFNPLSFPIFIGYFFLSYIFFSLFYSLGNELQWNEFKDHFYRVVLIMIGLIVLQIVFQPHLHPDLWHGGTGDAHFAGIFLAYAFIFITSEALKSTRQKRFNLKEIAIAISTFPILFFVDAKTIFIFTLIVFLGIVVFSLDKLMSRVGFLAALLCVALLWLNFSDRKLPISIISLKENVYYVKDYTGNYTNTDKFILIKSAIRTFSEDPQIAINGSGPGTFLSKTAVLKKKLIQRIERSKPLAIFDEKREFIRELLQPKDSWAKIKYAGIDFEKRSIQSYFDWRSSLINIFFEFGIVGLALFAWFIVYLFVYGFESYKISRPMGYIIISLSTLFIMLIYLSYWGEAIKYQTMTFAILGKLVLTKQM